MRENREQIEKEDWREAPGIIVSEEETNSAFAKRDYSGGCNAQYCIIVIKGYHIWWCSAHHQPHTHCQQDKAQIAELERIKKQKKPCRIRIMSTKEFISKCCRAKLVGDGSRRYYSPHRLAILTPKCSCCHKPCSVVEKK